MRQELRAEAIVHDGTNPAAKIFVWDKYGQLVETIRCREVPPAGLLAAFAHEHHGSQAVVLDVTDAQAVLDVAARLQTESPLDLVCYCAGHYTHAS